jgi:hypothetical protein
MISARLLSGDMSLNQQFSIFRNHHCLFIDYTTESVPDKDSCILLHCVAISQNVMRRHLAKRDEAGVRRVMAGTKIVIREKPKGLVRARITEKNVANGRSTAI